MDKIVQCVFDGDYVALLGKSNARSVPASCREWQHTGNVLQMRHNKGCRVLQNRGSRWHDIAFSQMQ